MVVLGKFLPFRAFIFLGYAYQMLAMVFGELTLSIHTRAEFMLEPGIFNLSVEPL